MTTQKELPKTITVVFTEEDRVHAGMYKDNDNCLMATALKRMGYNHDTEVKVSGGGITYLNGIVYFPRHSTPFDAGTVCNADRHTRPYYDKSVVGRKVILERPHGTTKP
jgi:hypothetical protein